MRFAVSMFAWACVSLLARPVSAQRLELLVMGPGDSFYERYGHTALRVIGPGDEDRVFNFGLTKFNRPNYMVDFLGGRVMFWGNVRPFAEVVARYQRDDRTLRRHPIALDEARARPLVAKLEDAVRPENREFLYDTFRQNCATRVRDFLDEATGGAVRAALAGAETDRAFHDDVRVAFANLPHLLLPLEWVPGPEMDRPRDLWDLAYHPETLAEGLAQVQVDGVPLLGPPVVEYVRQGPWPLTGWPHWGQALIVGLAALVLGLAWRVQRASPRVRAGIAISWILPSVFFGGVLTFVHFWSDWPDMHSNLLMAGCFVGDVWLVGPAWRLRKADLAATRWVSGYLNVRLTFFAALVVLGLFVAPLTGSLPPRLVALAGLVLLKRCLTAPKPA